MPLPFGPPHPRGSSADAPWWTPLVLLAVYTLVLLASLVGLYCQRLRQPLKARSPVLLAASALGGYLLVLWMLLLESGVVPASSRVGCSLGTWAMNLGHPLLFLPYLLRCYRLHLVFNLTVERRDTSRRRERPGSDRSGYGTDATGGSTTPRRSRASSMDSRRSATPQPQSLSQRSLSQASGASSTSRYYHARKHRITDGFLLKVMCALALAAAAVAAVDEWYVMEGDGPFSWQQLYVCNYRAVSFVVVWDTVRFLETLSLTVALYKLWAVADAFSIRHELLLVGGIWVLDLILRVALGIYDPALWTWTQPWALCVRSSACLFASVLLPLFATACRGGRGDPVLLWSEQAALASLRSTLHDPECVLAFQKFLVKRFSVENVLFWMEAELYRAGLFEADEGGEEGGRGAETGAGRGHSGDAGGGRGGGRGGGGRDADGRRVSGSYGLAAAMGEAEASRARRAHEARFICDRYIAPDAHLSLSVLDEPLKQDLLRSVEAGICPRDLFDRAQEIVYAHMQAECWEDFLTSSECRKAMRRVRRQETIRSRLIGAGMVDR